MPAAVHGSLSPRRQGGAPVQGIGTQGAQHVRSAHEVCKEYCDPEAQLPVSDSDMMQCIEQLTMWMRLQPGLMYRESTARTIARRLVQIRVFSVAMLVTCNNEELNYEFKRFGESDDPDNPIFQMGHPSGLLLMKAHQLAVKLTWGEREAQAEPAPGQRGETSGNDTSKILEALLPFMTSQQSVNNATAATQKKLARALEDFGKAKSKTRKDYADHGSDSSDDEKDKDRVDLGYVLSHQAEAWSREAQGDEG